MAAREFHFQDGTSNRFWTIELGAKSFTVRFGRTGTAGQTQTKEFSSEAAARAAHDKLVAEKVKKGYKEVTGSQPATPTPARAAPEAPTRQPPAATAKGAAKRSENPSLLSQLPKRLQKDLQEPHQNRFAKLSLKEWLAACWNFEAFYKNPAFTFPDTDEAIAARVAGYRLCPTWSPAHVRVALSFDTIAQNGIDPIARRILRGDPAELALGESLTMRLGLITAKLTELKTTCTGREATGFPPHLAQIIRAFAVRDVQWAQLLADYDYAGAGVKLQDEELALLAAQRRDIDSVRRHFPRGRIPKEVEWRWSCLRGIAESNPELVRAGLQKELERNRGSRAAMQQAGYGIVNIEVHGFYRLCEHVSPALVSTFDVRQSFPWDVEFHEWVQAHENPLAGLDLGDISPVLHDALVLLNLPVEWTSSIPVGSAFDLCDLVLTDLGPKPDAVIGWLAESVFGSKEKAEQLVATCPAVVGKAVDRCMLTWQRLGLLGAGASVEIRKVADVVRTVDGDGEETGEPAPEYGFGSIHDEMLPIAVNLADVEGALGSRNTALLNLLVEKFKFDIASDDRFVADRLGEGVLPDADEEENQGNEDSNVSEEGRRGMLDAVEGIKERLLKGESLDQALESLDENAAVAEAHKDAIKDLLGTLGDALGRAAFRPEELTQNLKVGQVGRLQVDLDDGAGNEDEADEHGDGPQSAVSVAEVLRCLVMGERPAGPVPYRYMYGCALRYLALHFGEVLPHDQWDDFNSSAFPEIDKALRTAGVQPQVLSLAHLVDRGAPIAAIPESHDGLRVGYLRRQEIDPALATLATAKRDRVDEDLAVFVEDIHDWLRACADSGRDLLCFSAH
jgi:predicted DNA-binding WGR domain protein